MKTLLCNLTIFLILGYAPLPGAERPNISVIDSLTLTIVETTFAETPVSPGDTIAMNIDLGTPQEAEYCRQRIGRYLNDKSLTIFRNYNRLSSFHGLVIEISRFRPASVYSEPESDGFFGENYSERTVQVYLTGQLFDAAEGRIIGSIEGNLTARDRIKYSMIDELELSEFPFTKGKRQAYSGWETVLEPLLVVSSVAVVVLLFFTQRN